MPRPVLAFGRIFLLGSHSLASPLSGLFRFARLASCRYGILAGSLAEHPLTISGSLPRTLRKGSLSAGTSSPAGSVRLEFSSDCFSCGFSVVFLFSGMRVSFSRFRPAFCETTLLEGAAGSLPSGSSQPAGSVQVKEKEEEQWSSLLFTADDLPDESWRCNASAKQRPDA